MKKIIMSKWFPSLVLIVTELVLLVVLHSVGFRITYPLALENSWDAISAVAAWVGVFASFVAIWFAIQIPKKIADRQDKIALFEKRYECFQTFEKCYVLYVQLKEKELTLEELRDSSRYMFNKLNWKDVTRDVAMEQIERYECVLHQMEFLFPGIDENDTYQLYTSLQSFLVSIIENKDINENKKKYIESMRYFSKRYSEIIWGSLKI